MVQVMPYELELRMVSTATYRGGKMINLCLLILTGCYAEPPKEGIRFERYEIKVDDRFSVKAELGELEVPENRLKPDGNKITLQFVP